MKVCLNAVLLGESPAFEQHLKKTGLLYDKAGSSEIWPENRPLYLWAGEEGFFPKEKLMKLFSQGRHVLAPKRCQRLFAGTLPKSVHFFPDAWTKDVPGRRVSRVKSFQMGTAQPREEVAAVPRMGLRQELWRQILGIYSGQGWICPRLSFYPSGYQSVFSFRVDADEYDAELFNRFFDTAMKYSRAISLFFSMANYEPHGKEIQRCLRQGFDVHSHAYAHFTYRSAAQNRYNLAKADEALRRAGAAKKGFASPYGRWNPGLQRAIEESAYDFTSEFSYNYDDLPSYPVIDGRRCSVLQLPVHPVGLGVYLESGPYHENEVRHYYKELFEKKLECGEPIIFYDHPTKWLGVYPEFMDFLFGLASSHSGVWVCSMSEWAAWWKKREKARVDVFCEPGGERYEVSAENTDGSFELQFFNSSGQTASASLPPGRGEAVFSRLSWRSLPPKMSFDEGAPCRERSVIKRAKSAVKSWLDWEKVTPRPEIIQNSIPSRVKFVLRHLKK